MNLAVIGIDPGINGGVAAIRGDKILLLDRCPKKKINASHDYDVEEMTRMLESLKEHNPCVYIEKVNAMPMQGVVSMFNFGRGFGIWIGICAGLKIPLKFVTPRQWKKKMILAKDKDKKASIDTAKQLFPDIDLKPGRLIRDHDGMAEALLIAVYGGYTEWK